jgi:hypothetical protein
MSEEANTGNDLKLSFEQAAKEVKEWLNFKKVNDFKRVNGEDNIGRLIRGFAFGTLVMDPDTKVITQKLLFPVGKEIQITELKFKPRIEISEVQSRLTGVGPDDGVGRALAYISAATGESSAVISKLDPEDYHLSGDLVVFFMMAG